MGPETESLGHQHHNHQDCVQAALTRAQDLCTDRKVRLTPLRLRVLELVWDSHRPRGAYALLEALTIDGRRPSPLTVYRALEFLLEQGLVHRIESLNAYAGCPCPGTPHSGQFLICRLCSEVTELDDPGITRTLQAAGAAASFRIERQTVEISGLCRQCQDRGTTAESGSP
jgi:Fur family transcriptional regulator, zinc uptake regulator